MECEEILSLYELAKDAGFQGEPFARVKAHVDACPRCRERIAALAALDGPVAAALAAQAPAGFEKKVADAVRTSRGAGRLTRMRLACAAAIAILASLGAALIWSRVPPPAETARATWKAPPAAQPDIPSARGEALLVTATGPVAVWNAEKGAWLERRAGDKAAGLMRTGSGTKADVALGGATVTVSGGSRIEFPQGAGASAARIVQGSLRIEAPAGKEWSVSWGDVRCRGAGGASVISADAQGCTVRPDKGTVTARSPRCEDRYVHAGRSARFMSSGELADISATAFGGEAGGAAATPAVPPAPRTGAGRLALKDEKGREVGDLELRECKVEGKLIENVVYTQVMLTFWNNTDRRAEGTFYYSLPEGAAICRLALEVEPDKWMEGEMVERTKARKVFEDIVRRMQDPALMEWQKGNLFKTRIFPIPPNGPKRLIVGYIQALSGRYGQMRYSFPVVSEMTSKMPIGRFELTLDMETSVRFRGISAPAYPEAQVRFGGEKGQVRISREKFSPEKDVLVVIDRERLSQAVVTAFAAPGEDGYFLISTEPAFQGRDKASDADERGRDVLFLVDTSLSRGGPEGIAQARIFGAFLKELGPKDRFHAVAFDVSPVELAEGWSSGDAARRRATEKLAAILPLGGTDVGAAIEYAGLLLGERGNDPRQAEVVMLTDGIATMGEQDRARMIEAARKAFGPRKARVHAIATGSGHDGLFLRSVCRDSGGRFVPLSLGDDLEGEIFRLSLLLDENASPAPAAEFSGGGISQVYPSELEPLPPGQEVLLVGRYKKGGRCELKLSLPDGDAGPETYAFDLPDASAANAFLPALWARMRMDCLMVQPQSQETWKEIVELAETYCLMSPYTSFLALESEKQYQEYGIDRKKRRKFWDAADNWTPPSRRAPDFAEQPPQPTPAQPQPVQPEWRQPKPPERPQPKPPKPFTIGDLDLNQLFPSDRMRLIATALASLCLGVYYRYLPLYANDAPVAASPGPVRQGAPEPLPPQPRVQAQAPDATPAGPIASPGPDVRNLRDVYGDPSGSHSRAVVVPTPHESLKAPPTPAGPDAPNAPRADGLIADVPLSGVDVGEGHGSFGSRFGGGRRQTVVRYGGSVASESACSMALRYPARIQAEAGFWGSEDVAATSLTLLSLLGAGHTERAGMYRDNVRRAVCWLISRQKDNGSLSDDALTHALATLALCEAAGMGRLAQTLAAAQKAMDRVASLQDVGGGFRAAQEASPDVWTTFWFVAAMKSAKVAGLTIDVRVFQRVIEFLDAISDAHMIAGLTGKPPADSFDPHAVAAGCAARLFLGWRKEEIQHAADLLVTELPEWGATGEKADYALWYMKTLVLFQMGGDLWKRWNEAQKPTLIDHQTRGGRLDGSWPAIGRWRFPMGRAEPKAMTEAEVSEALKAAVERADDAAARETLISRVREVEDEKALERLASAAPEAAVAGQIVRARLALRLHQKERYEESAKALDRVFDAAGRPNNLLVYMVDCLCKRGLVPQAVETLRTEILAGRADPWKCELLPKLLLDEKSGVAEPVEYAEKHFPDVQVPGAATVRHNLACLLRGRGDLARTAAAFKGLYEASGSDDGLLDEYAAAMRAAGRGEDLLQRMIFEARRGLFDDRRKRLVADVLFDDPSAKTKPEAFVKLLAPRTAVRISYLKHLGERAKAKARWDLAADWYGEVFRTMGERFDDAWDYIEATHKAGRTKEALADIERMVRCGYREDRAFMLLADVYKAAGRPRRDLLRAASSPMEAHPDAAKNHEFLMQFYEAIGDVRKALESALAAFEARPEDPKLGRRVVEKAMAAKAYPTAEKALFVLLETTWETHHGDVWGQAEKDIKEMIEAYRKSGDGKAARATEAKLRAARAVDIEVKVTWDTATDVDTHVIEPGGTECSYQRRATPKGGVLDHDDTDGYGPETYTMKRAQPGKYLIEVNQYSGGVSSEKPSTVTVQITTHKSSDDEKTETIKVKLTDAKDRKRVKGIEWK